MTIGGPVAEDLVGWPPAVPFDVATAILDEHPDDAEALLIAQVTARPAWFIEAVCSAAAGDLVVAITGGVEHVVWSASCDGTVLASALRITEDGLAPLEPEGEAREAEAEADASEASDDGAAQVGEPEEPMPDLAASEPVGDRFVDLRVASTEAEGWVDDRILLLGSEGTWYAVALDVDADGVRELLELDDVLDVLVPACGRAGIPPSVCGALAAAFAEPDPASDAPDDRGDGTATAGGV